MRQLKISLDPQVKFALSSLRDASKDAAHMLKVVIIGVSFIALVSGLSFLHMIMMQPTIYLKWPNVIMSIVLLLFAPIFWLAMRRSLSLMVSIQDISLELLEIKLSDDQALFNFFMDQRSHTGEMQQNMQKESSRQSPTN